MKRKKAYSLKHLVFPLSGFLLLMGCQLPPEKKDSIKQMQAILQQASDQNLGMRHCAKPMPMELKKALMPNMKYAGNHPLPELQKRFDLMAEQVPAKTFFLSLVEGTPYNITVHPGVEGRISLQLKKVTVLEVLETVRNVYGFDFRRTAAGIEVLPATLQTRAFSVNYLDINRTGDSETQVSAGTLRSPNGSNTNNTTNNPNANTTTSTQGNTSNAPLNSTITTTSKADFWKELHKAVEAIVGSGEGRRVAISPLASLIVVQAMPDELKRVDDFLKSAELSLNRQVILEAKIIEVELNDSYQAGINWSVLSGQMRAAQLGGETIKNVTLPGDPFPVLSDSLTAAPINISPGLPGPFNPATNVHAFGGVFALSTSFKHLGTLIELLGAQGKVQVLSSPRVSTMNNQKALIKIGTDRFFITNVSTTTSASTGSTSITPNVTFDTFFSGIALDVTPHITAKDIVTLHIHPTISVVEDDTKTFTLSNQTQSIPLAKSSVRESDSIVRARNGEMVVIGGLMQNSVNERKQGIPFLKNLPVVGGAFRHTVQKAVKSELVILLRPIVVDDHQKAWNGNIDASLDRLNKLDDSIRVDETRYHGRGADCYRNDD